MYSIFKILNNLLLDYCFRNSPDSIFSWDSKILHLFLTVQLEIEELGALKHLSN